MVGLGHSYSNFIARAGLACRAICRLISLDVKDTQLKLL